MTKSQRDALDRFHREIEGIKGAVAEGDNEKAHGIEERLREDVLGFIRENYRSSVVVRLASDIALSTNEISFERW